jgi:[glutamine synthetase] adenylyltransferase / [glutamine synthetase]-adenylyl-L-tyrosine phosphorylase
MTDNVAMPLNVKDLLLASRLERQDVNQLLAPFGLKDTAKADANLQAMASDPSDRQLLADVLEQLLTAVAQSADPDQALTYLERFARAALNKTRLISYLQEVPRALEVLIRTLGASPYMAEILIRDPQHFYWLTDPQILHSNRKKRAIQHEFGQTLRVLEGEATQLDYLRFVKRREMLHIGVRDLLRLCSVEETLAALSTLAETLITMTHWVCASALRQEYGLPKKAFTGFTILGMGKLGGGELNFSSDVDLVYLYASDSEQAGSIAAPDYFRRLCTKISAGLKDFTAEGYMYRVDLRLRPEGKSGYVAYPLDGFERYYRSRLATWERLALSKAWPVAGDRALGRRFLQMAHPFVYEQGLDANAMDDIRSIKTKINQQMGLRDQRRRNVKLGTGGIREIELIVQSLQVGHGADKPGIQYRNTLKALAALREEALISEEDWNTLRTAYLFLRDVENKLQMANDAQTHSLPRDEAELNVVARTLGYGGAEDFLREYQRQTREVNRIFENHFSQ